MVRRLLPLTVLVLLQAPAFAEGEGHGHGVAFKAGALGLGLEYTFQMNDRFAFRGGINGSEFGGDGEESGIFYDVDVIWDSVSVGVDFHPLKSAFRLSAGMLSSDNRLEAVSRPTTSVTIGDTVYTPAQVGTLVGEATFDDTVPFLGLGWDWSRDAKVFGMSLDLGVLDQGEATVRMIGTGTLFGDPAFRADIDAEEAELEDALSDLEIAPYISLGFVFRF